MAALSGNATLEGVALLQQAFVHTYVRSSCGTSWGCHGSFSGGTSLCKGTGSSFEANCIEGKDEAGISYLITGVCHQIANRILAAAAGRVILPDTIAQIRGTYAVFDEYGWNLPGQQRFDTWPARKIVCAASPSAGQSSGSSGPSSGSTGYSIPGFKIGSIDVIESGVQGGDPLTRRSRLGALIRAAGLSHPIDDNVLEGLARMQSSLQVKQRELGQLVATQRISREKYIVEFDKALQEASRVGEDLLGYDAFHKVFGEFRIQSMGDVGAFTAGRPVGQ